MNEMQLTTSCCSSNVISEDSDYTGNSPWSPLSTLYKRGSRTTIGSRIVYKSPKLSLKKIKELDSDQEYVRGIN